jgi:hypothetical protein
MLLHGLSEDLLLNSELISKPELNLTVPLSLLMLFMEEEFPPAI